MIVKKNVLLERMHFKLFRSKKSSHLQVILKTFSGKERHIRKMLTIIKSR